MKRLWLAFLLLLLLPTISKSSSRVEDVSYSFNYSSSSHISPLKKERVARANKKIKRYTYSREEPVYGSHFLVNTARKYIGKNPTKHRSLWCADFINLVLRENGLPGTRSRAARAFSTYGRPSIGKVGDIAVMSRGPRSGHVGLVAGYCPDGKVKLLSGNFGRQLTGYGCYPKNRFIAFRSA